MISNVGFSGLLVMVSVLAPIVILIFFIAMMVAVFQMRRSMQNASDKLDDIYKLLLEHKKS